MTEILGWLLVALAASYAGLMAMFGAGLRRVLRRPQPVSVETVHPMVTVVIPARNEESTIDRCLDSVLGQDYPAECMEVVVVDDLSTDGTAHIVQARARTDPRVRLVRIPENAARDRAHKKRAIEKAVEVATGTHIVSTDADCTHRGGWLRHMMSAFGPGVGIVSGPVAFRRPRGWLQNIQALEFLGLVSLGAGAMAIGLPNLCSGANLAYRRDVFEEVGGFSGLDHVTSGDDELLLHRIAYESSWRPAFCSSPGALVETEPCHSIGAFMDQRRRWGSKALHYRPASAWVTGTVALVFAAGLLAGTLAAPFVSGLAFFVVATWALKLTGELTILVQGCVHFGQARLLAYLPLAEILHLPYVILAPSLGVLRGFQWKERTLKQ